LPQPLPDYPEGEPITPPRIVVDEMERPETVVRVPAGCLPAQEPVYPLNATLIDTNTLEAVQARWFVNYDPANSDRRTPRQENGIAGSDETPPVIRRSVPTFSFHPYDPPPVPGTGNGSGAIVGAMHVVELVVSNGFHAPPEAAPLPYRSPAAGFETQLYRWTFLTVAADPPGCAETDPGCVPCPEPPEPP
jgi:hypothetical protein